MLLKMLGVQKSNGVARVRQKEEDVPPSCFLTLALVTSGTIFFGFEGCPVHCSKFSSISSLYTI